MKSNQTSPEDMYSNQLDQSNGLWSRLKRRFDAIKITSLIALLVIVPGYAQAGWLYLNQNSFGANQFIYAELGTLSYLTGCGGGIDDFIYASANVYLVPASEPGNGASLSDVGNASGTPNTIGPISTSAGFIDEFLGATGPGGSVISGDYAVVIDECQDGFFNAGQDFYGALFTVRIPSDVSSFTSPQFSAQLAAMKSEASVAADRARTQNAIFEELFDAFIAYTLFGAATDPADFLLFACTNIDLDSGRLYCSPGDALQGLINLKRGMVSLGLNQVAHYEGIAADPPDPNYMPSTVLRDGLNLSGVDINDPVINALVDAMKATAEEASVAGALWKSMERYQGAQIAGVGEYAFTQARHAEDHARQLAGIYPQVITTLNDLQSAMTASGEDFVAILSDYQALQTRIASSGLTVEERARLISAGYSNQDIDDRLAVFLAKDFSVLSTATGVGNLATALSADMADKVTALNNFADAFAAEQTSLAAQLTLPFPNANAGGPYNVDEGVAITLDASATTHPSVANTALSYAWDFDQDGEFDDATGMNPSVTFNSETDTLIGVRAMDAAGHADVGYTQLVVNNVNSSPEITATSPASPVTVAHDSAVTFSVTALDPDGDTLSYEWFKDGVSVGTGVSYAYTASLGEVGEHVVNVNISDGSPLSNDTAYNWAMTVTAPDADGDGYGSNIDCNDGNPAINPGAAEIYLNGVDDDCNPATPDNPDMDGDGYDYTVDCNDSNAAINPGAAEICNGVDDNCNGTVDEGFDLDGDGISSCDGDCNDANPNVYPGATEICNLIDDNCNGSVDEGFDVDGDGFSVCGGDCNDSNAAINPGATEVCNLVDDNCNASVDEGFDADGDGVTTCGGDCNDGDASIYPGRQEICNGIDDNCNSVIDEGGTDDFDGDGVTICDGDCNDANAAVFPGNTETCNGVDDNCSGVVDEGFDLDGDGFTTCSLPVADCNDANGQIYPGRQEIFHNGIDDDCNAATLDDYAGTFIVATDDNGRIYYASSNGDGTWSNYAHIETISGYIRGATIADYDNDGDLDILVGSPSGNDERFYLLINNGSDNFTNVGVVGSGTGAGSYEMDMTAGDFNHDGNMDFIAGGNSRYIYYGVGDGSGGFTVTTIDNVIYYPRGLDVADFNHDGHLDYALTYNSGEFHVYLGDGAFGFTDSGVIADSGSDPYGLSAADFNNDGHPDVIVNNSSTGDAYFYAGNGDGTFAAGVYIATIDFGNHGAFDNYDFNRDGNQDLITTSYSSRIIRYYPGNGDGTFGAAVQVNTSNTLGNILGVSAPPGPPPAGDPVPYISPPSVSDAIGATVNFSASLSTDNGSIVSYEWDFDDGSGIATGVDVSHTFPSDEANHTVRLTVTDNDGNVAIAVAPVKLLGEPPIADSGGPYTFGESFATGGIYTVNLDGSGSSDDGAAPIQFDWNLGNGLNETFVGSRIRPGLWAMAGAVQGTNEAIVTGNGSWGQRYLVTNVTYPRVPGDSYRGRVMSDSSSRTMMWGIKNSSGNYSYTQFIYAIYFNGTAIQIYEGGSNRGTVSSYSPGTSYDVRIDVKTTGAFYYMRPTGTATWNMIYNSAYSEESLLRLGMTVANGEWRLDEFTTSHQRSSQEQPTASYYNGPGTYNISLDVEDGVGQTDTELSSISLVVGAPPVADAGGPYVLTEANANCDQWTVTFDASGSTDDNGIYLYEWDFGDGTTGTGVSPTHTYTGQALRNVTLTVTDHVMQSNTTTTTVTMAPGAPPVAVTGGPYSVDESAATAGMWSAAVSGTTSTDDTGICDYVWDFGDGTPTESGGTLAHQYAAAGTYTVQLTVRDNANQTNTATTTYTVSANETPVGDSGGPYTADESVASNGNFTVVFDASGTTDDFGIWTYAWDFGDGTTGSGVSPTHVYDGVGTYDVTLTVTDNGRQTNVVTTTVTISGNGAPVADAGPNRVVEVGMPVLLDASGSTDDFGIATFSWDFDLPATFVENFSAGIGLDWTASGATESGGEVTLEGANSWTTRYLVTNQQFTRNAGDSYTGRMNVSGTGNRYVMWGLKNTAATSASSYNYNQFYYAIYFNNGSIYIYEGGASRGVQGTYTDGTDYDLRIDVKSPSGATYYVRETGTTSWTQLYDSTYQTATDFRFGLTVNSGTIVVDDFAGPGPSTGPVRNDIATVEMVYKAVGTYTPTVTVTDHADQTDTDSATVTVLLGNPPVANAGGPYNTNEAIPTRFNARASTDDFGIRTYTWDFGDGSALFTTRNPFADHVYTTAGSYTATLTTTDFAGQSSSNQATVNVSDAPVVAAVPWQIQGGIEVPHDTWDGGEVTLKAVAWSNNTPLTYTWNFGDGSAPVSGTVTNPYMIEARHVYNGVDGQPFVATVTVTDSTGASVSDQYRVRIRQRSLDIEINVAIDDALWYLHNQQNRGVSGSLLNGYWQFSSYPASSTASSVQAFQINGHLEQGDVREDPYVETVRRGLNSLYSYLQVNSIGDQTYGNPDSDGNFIGIDVNSGRPIYEGGMVMDAIASTGSPNTYADTGNTGIINRSYKEIARDMLDMYAWGQYNDANVGGGWRYGWNQHPDNSAAQWGAIGELAVRQVFGLEFPQWVLDRNNVWLNYSYNGSGFGYTTAGNGQGTTPSGMVQLDMNGVETSDPRWIAAETTLSNNWNAWYRGNTFYYALFAMTKALRLANPSPVVTFSNGTNAGLDWFNDPVNGLARTLVDDAFASADGSFTPTGAHVGQPLHSAWGVIMLTPTLFVQPPVADAGDDRVWGVDVPLQFDGSGSFHLDPFRDIVLYEWDLDGDGVYDVSSTEPTTTFTYTTENYPEATLPRNITVTLRVTDNNDPSQRDTDAVVITIAVPPHPPIADAGGPQYTCTAGLPCTLDGSGSFDIDPTDFITVWQWDTDNDGQYDDASGETVDITFDTAGIYNVGLRVEDNAVLNDVNGNGVQDPEERLDDHDFATVVVVANEAPTANIGGPYVVNEGSAVTLDASASSDPNGDALTYAWDLDNDGAFDDATGPNPSFTGVDDGVYPISVQVSDGLLTDTATGSVTVNNVAPAVEAGPNQTSDEGDSVTFAGSFTDPGSADTHTIEWDFGDGSTATGSLTPSHTYVNQGVYTVTLTVTDDDSGVGSDTLTVTVGNLPPVVEAGVNQSVAENETVNLDPATFTDAGIEDTHTATIDWGDGSATEVGTVTQGAGSGSVAGSHSYPTAGTYTVTVTVFDDSEDSGSDTLTVTVGSSNVAPVVEAGANQSISEGGTVSLDPATFTDADTDDTHTASILWGDGSAAEAGSLTQGAGSGSVDGSHAYPTAGTYTVTVIVTDNEGASGSDTFTVTVAGPENQPPVANIGGPYAVNEGSAVTLDASGSSDPDSDPLTYAWDLDNDGAFDDATGPTASFTGVDDGVYPVAVQVSDGQLTNTATGSVTVNNVAPAVEAGPNQASNEGDAVTFAGSFTDPGTADTHTIEWNFGDGATSSGSLTPSHTYDQDGVYTVTLTVTDDDSGVGSDTLTVTVGNQPPVVEAGANQTISEGDSVSLDPATFTDAGIEDVHTATINWGDGSATEAGVVTQGAGSGSVAGSHTFTTAGTYTVTVTVTDSGGASGSDTLTVTVEGTAPEPISDLVARAKDSKIDLVWSPVAGATYNVYRSTTQGGPYVAIATDYASSYATYADLGLTNGTTYYYVVRVVINGSEVSQSNEASGTPAALRTR